MSDTYKLQLRHLSEEKSFSTRDEVIKYIDGQLKYGGNTLSPYEMVLLYYGEEDDKNTIIMVGLPEGETNDGQSYFLIDTADLKSQLETKISEVEEEFSGMNDAIEEETEERKAADETLQENIDAEATARENADNILESDIDAETAAREEADTTLQENIDAEAKTREEADADLQSKIEAETTAREEADEEIQASLEFSKDDIASVIEACGLIYNEKMTEDRVSYEPDVHDDIISDATSISDAIDKISKFVIQATEDLSLTVKSTNTVDLVIDESGEDRILTADVRIATAGGLSTKNYDNNILGQTIEGMYASASIEPSATNPNVLVFKTSGYVNGEFKVDANETEVTLAPYKGDTGKETGIEVVFDNDTVSAKLNLSTDASNILKLKDGEYMVDGKAKNITYNNSYVELPSNTVKAALDALFDAADDTAKNTEYSDSDTVDFTAGKDSNGCNTLTADVKLSSDESIVVANGGLSVALEMVVDTKMNTLTAKLGNNEQTVKLPGVSIINSVEYVSPNVVITFADGSVLKIPMDDLLTTYTFKDDTTGPVHFDVDSSTNGSFIISANLRLRSTNNLLAVENGYLYVDKDDIVAIVDSDLGDTKDNLNALTETVGSLKDELAEEISTREKEDIQLQNNIDAETAARTSEIARVEALVTGEDTSIAELKEKVSNIEAKNIEQDTAITAVQTNLDTETATRSSEVARVEALVDTNTNDISDLKSKVSDIEAKNVEQDTAITAVQTNLDTETATRTSEIARVEALVNTNTNDISNIKSDISDIQATDIEQDKTIATLQNDLEKETTARENSEANITTTLENEITRATEAESKLSEEISNLTTNLSDSLSEAKTYTDEKVSTEADERKAADDALQTAVDSKVGSVVLTKEEGSDLVYHLTVDGEDYIINIPEDQFLKSVDYESGAKRLKFVFHTSEGEEIVYVDVDDLVDTYTAGNGLMLTNNRFSVLVNEDTEPYIKVTSEGISIIGIDEALANVTTDVSSTVESLKTEVETYTDNKVAEEANARETAIEALQTEVDGKVGSVTLTQGDTDYVYHLNVDGTDYTIKIPEERCLESVEYDSGNKQLVFTFHTSDGNTTENVSLLDLSDIYTAGNGLTLNDHEFSVRLNEDTEPYIKVTEEGVSIIGIDEALSSLKSTVDEEMSNLNTDTTSYIDSKVAAEAEARENADSELSDALAKEIDRATTAESELSDDIKNLTSDVQSGLSDAKSYTDSKVSDEADERKAADDALQVEIDGKVGSVTIEKEVGSDLVYHLYVDGKSVSIINIPEDQFLKSVEYESAAHRLKFAFHTSNGDEDVYVDVSDLVDTYLAGNGLKATDTDKGVEFSIRLDEDSQQYIQITEEGISLVGIDEALDNLKKEVEEYTDEQVADEADKRQEADDNLSDALNQEIERATTVEGELSDTLNQEIERATTSEQTISDALGEETERATTAEGELSDALNQEIERATTTEEELRGLITTEKERAIAAEESLRDDLEAEAATRETNDNTLQENLNSEAATREANDNTLQDNLNSEAATREANDNILQGNINTEATTREENDKALESRIEGLESDLATEEKAREDADTTLQNAINDEKTERTSADTTLQNAINSEESARISADTTLQNAINTEEAARISADTTLSNSISTETTDRIAADNALQTAVDGKIGSVTIEPGDTSLYYHLVVDGKVVSTITIPEDQFLKSAEYDAGNKQLIFVFHTTTGDETVYVSVKDLVDTYLAGDGLTSTDTDKGVEFSVRISHDSGSEGYLVIMDDGSLDVVGVNSAIQSAVADEAALREDADNTLTDNLNSEITNRENADDELKSLIEKEAEDRQNADSVLEDALDTETNRAEGVEEELRGLISTETSRSEGVEEELRGLISTETSNRTTVDTNLQAQIDNLGNTVDTKANASDVYTKTEVSNQISSAIATIPTYTAGTGISITNTSGNTYQISGTYTGSNGITVSGNSISGSSLSSSISQLEAIVDNVYTKDEVDVKIAEIVSGGEIDIEGLLEGYATKVYVDSGLSSKQNTLTAGDGIRISSNTISVNLSGSTGITVSGSTIGLDLKAGDNINISGNTISADLSSCLTATDAANTYATKEELNNAILGGGDVSVDLSGYQEKLTAGENITIENNTISANIDLSDYLTKADAGNTYATKDDLNNAILGGGDVSVDLSGYQERLTAGENITIENNVISADVDLSDYLTKEDAKKSYVTSEYTGDLSFTTDMIVDGTITVTGDDGITVNNYRVLTTKNIVSSDESVSVEVTNSGTTVDLSVDLDNYLTKTDAENTYATKEDLNNAILGGGDADIDLSIYQKKLTAGDNIVITDDNEISVDLSDYDGYVNISEDVQISGELTVGVDGITFTPTEPGTDGATIKADDGKIYINGDAVYTAGTLFPIDCGTF